MPGQICAVATCTTSFYKSKRDGEEVVFFRFPKSSLLAEWVRRCFRRDPFNVNTARICSKYFLPSDFEDEIKAKIMKVPRKLKETALPTIHLKPDIMNSRFLSEVFPKKQAFGRQLDEQNKILVSTIELFQSMLCVGKNKLQIFQKGVLISSMSLKELYSSLKLKHKDFKFILTHRLNQDCLENFFFPA